MFYCVNVFIPLLPGAQKGQKKIFKNLQTQSHRLLWTNMWVLGIEFMSFAKAINAINCSAHLYASKVMGFIMVPSYTCVLMPCSYLPPSLLLLPNIAGPFLCPNSNYPVCFYITCILSHVPVPSSLQTSHFILLSCLFYNYVICGCHICSSHKQLCLYKSVICLSESGLFCFT